MDKQIQKFREALIQVINSSALPPSVAFYVLKDVLLEVESIVKQVLAEEERQPEKSAEPEVSMKINEIKEEEIK